MDGKTEAQQLQGRLREWRRYLHAHAEVGFDLPQTTAFVQKTLSEMGVTALPCGRAGLVADIGAGEPVFLLRADMDALPMQEQTNLSFAARNGNMHACGHDMHTAMLLGAAQLLKWQERELKGTVRLMFQPAEEILEGARDMIRQGVLRRPPVAAGMMLHVMSGVPFPAGTILLPAPGVGAPCADFFTVTVTGKACHGSMPQKGIDPLSAAAYLVLAWQELSARECGPGEEAVLTVGSFSAGQAANVIPEQAVIRGSLRALSEEVRNRMKERMVAMAEHITAAFRAESAVCFDSGCPTLQNDAALIRLAETVSRRMWGEKVHCVTEQSGDVGRGGSEDFAYVSHEIPTVMVALAAGQGNSSFPLHHPQLVLDESVLAQGSALLAAVAVAYGTTPGGVPGQE